MRCNLLISGYNERLVGARGALDPRFLAQTALPFIGAGRRITALTGLEVFPAQREYVAAPPKQASKQIDLGAVVEDLILPRLLQRPRLRARSLAGGVHNHSCEFVLDRRPLLLQLAKTFLETPLSIFPKS